MVKWAQSKTGFTIVELLIVVVVIAILAAITIVAYNGIQRQAQHSVVMSTSSSIVKAVEARRVTHNTYPNSISDCPSPASENLCISAGGGTTVTYNSIPASTATSGWSLVKEPSYEVSVLSDKTFYYTSPAEKTGSREFVQFFDAAPFIDKYGLVPYVLSFEIKSANTGSPLQVQAYFQNGSAAKYGGLGPFVTPTNSYTRHEFTFTPTLLASSETRSMVAFYGGYDTGNIITIRNVSFRLK